MRRLNASTAELGKPFATAGLCYYRRLDGVAWHGDTIGRGSTEDNYGGDRQPRRHPRLRCGRVAAVHRCDCRWRMAICVVGGSCQRTFEHAVPDIGADGSAREHPVPAARRPLTRSTPDRGHRLYEQIANCVSTRATARPGITSGLAMTITW